MVTRRTYKHFWNLRSMWEKKRRRYIFETNFSSLQLKIARPKKSAFFKSEKALKIGRNDTRSITIFSESSETKQVQFFSNN